MTETIKRIGVIGAGAWGTALGQLCAEKGCATTIWAREPEVAEAINTNHENTVFLKGIKLAPELRATNEYGDVTNADALLMVAPAQHLRSVSETLAPHISKGMPVVICSKGIEESTGKLLTEVLGETLPEARLAVLSGPTLAGEIARGQPTAVTLASIVCDASAVNSS